MASGPALAVTVTLAFLNGFAGDLGQHPGCLDVFLSRLHSLFGRRDGVFNLAFIKAGCGLRLGFLHPIRQAAILAESLPPGQQFASKIKESEKDCNAGPEVRFIFGTISCQAYEK